MISEKISDNVYTYYRKEDYYMDIPALSMAMAQSNLMTGIGTALLSKTIEQAASVGNAVTELLDASAMEHSVYPELGGNIDISV